jgi:hypothetical protein
LRTAAAAAGGAAQLRGREHPSKIGRLAHYNFAQCGVGGRWRARALNIAQRAADRGHRRPCVRASAVQAGLERAWLTLARLQVGGKAVTGEKLDEVNKLLQGAPGSKVRLKLSRSGMQFDVTLVRADESAAKKPAAAKPVPAKAAEPAGKKKLTDRERADRCVPTCGAWPHSPRPGLLCWDPPARDRPVPRRGMLARSSRRSD